MLSGNDERAERICPKTGRRIKREREHRCASWAMPFVGLTSLLWFLIRVIPKPSRAAYPCQRAAFPLASGFVVWLTGIIVSSLAYRKAKRLAGRARYVAAGLIIATDGRQTLYLIEPDPSGFQPIASAVLLKEGGTSSDDPIASRVGGATQNWSPMALADGKLLIRDQNQMKCVVIK